MGIIADLRRARKLAGILEFTCPACHRVIPRDQLRFHRHRADCPDCGAVVLAPPGHPTGLVGPPPPAANETPDTGTLASFGFFPAAAAGTLALYTLWMLPGVARAAAVGFLGWRPIGWEATGMLVLSLIVALAVALLILGLGLAATRRLPGVFGTAATIAACVAPVAVFHAFVTMPWSARMSHSNDWPAELTLVDFRVCAATFDLESETLAADGLVTFEVENRSDARMRSATFTVKTGRPSDWLEHNAHYRVTIPSLEPHARARIEQRLHLGNIMWKGASDYGGQAAASAILMWDMVAFEDGRAIALVPRPAAATRWPIPDCAGAKRPEVPWYIPPYTGPR